MAKSQDRYNRRWAILVGIGLALAPIHNRWLTGLVTSNGEVGFFLPAFGVAIWLMGSLAFAAWNWDRIKDVGWGSKQITFPLFIIVVAIGLSGITAGRWTVKFAPLLAGVSMFSLYLSVRVWGKDVFIPLAIGAGVASLGVIMHGIIFPGRITGGFVFEGNYDIVVGYVLLGLALFVHQRQWMLAGLALVAMFLTGSPEGVFVVGVMAIIVLWRGDRNARLVLAVAPVIMVAVLWFSIGYGQELYGYATQVVANEPTVIQPSPAVPLESAVTQENDSPASIAPESTSRLSALNYRMEVTRYALTNLKPLGEGYILTDFSRIENVHNVPLVIVQQLGYPGILAGLAWLWVSIWCLVKTRWKYAWALVLALSVFDHFIWTQLAPLFWSIVGVSTVTTNIKNDLMFKGNYELVSTEEG